MHTSAMRNTVSFIFIIIGLATVSSALAEKSVSNGRDSDILTLERATQIVLQEHPMIAAKKAQAVAMMQIPARVSSLEDPRISFNLANMPLDDLGVGNDPMTQIQLAVSQNVPYPGKLGLRKSIASFAANATEIDVTNLQLDLIQKVKQSWWKVFYNQKAIDTILRNQTLLRQLIEIAQVKYKVGKGIQQDVLLAHLELSKLLEEEIRLREVHRLSLIGLNRNLNRSATSPLKFPISVDVSLPTLSDTSELVKWSRAQHPVIKAKQKRIDSAKQKLVLARRDKYPNFRVAAIYGQRDSRSDLVSVQVGLSLPIFIKHKQQKMIDQRHSELLQMNYSLDDLYWELDTQINTAILKYKSASEQAALLKTGVIPQAQQTVDSMRAGYQVNQVDFLNLVRTQVTLSNYQTQYWRAISLAKQALAHLEAVVGKETIYE